MPSVFLQKPGSNLSHKHDPKWGTLTPNPILPIPVLAWAPMQQEHGFYSQLWI